MSLRSSFGWEITGNSFAEINRRRSDKFGQNGRDSAHFIIWQLFQQLCRNWHHLSPFPAPKMISLWNVLELRGVLQVTFRFIIMSVLKRCLFKLLFDNKGYWERGNITWHSRTIQTESYCNTITEDLLVTM